MIKLRMLSALALAALAGCASYNWKPTVPAELRSVAVPVFRNNTKVTELGAVATVQLLREVQREGTFKIVNPDDAALEIQGEIMKAGAGNSRGDRTIHGYRSQFDFDVTAKVSVIDRRRGKVLVDNRTYQATTFMTSDGDNMTAMRDASGRVAEDLARQIVDDLVGLGWRE